MICISNNVAKQLWKQMFPIDLELFIMICELFIAEDGMSRVASALTKSSGVATIMVRVLRQTSVHVPLVGQVTTVQSLFVLWTVAITMGIARGPTNARAKGDGVGMTVEYQYVLKIA